MASSLRKLLRITPRFNSGSGRTVLGLVVSAAATVAVGLPAFLVVLLPLPEVVLLDEVRFLAPGPACASAVPAQITSTAANKLNLMIRFLIIINFKSNIQIIGAGTPVFQDPLLLHRVLLPVCCQRIQR